jgi:hypothetical protein
MQVTTISQPPQVKASELPTLTVSPTPHRGLYARWEVVNGKLTCKWFNNPD